jgi:hypothetical protein
MRILLWSAIIFSIYIILIYLSIVLVWMILGAVINPSAFLPYATGASVLVTIVTTKYEKFKSLFQEGYKKIYDWIAN